MSEWQPIETAPKSSRSILVFCAALRNTYTVTYVVPLDESAKRNEAAAFWQHTNGRPLSERPTHWMQLPEPPK